MSYFFSSSWLKSELGSDVQKILFIYIYHPVSSYSPMIARPASLGKLDESKTIVRNKINPQTDTSTCAKATEKKIVHPNR
jgi:hypothetical protein|tara:strand:+ start:454 stop:693 length:240 start_codon:yes stop_codon:yes gene_type:complete